MDVPRRVADVAAFSAFQNDDALAEYMRLHGGVIGDYRSPLWDQWTPVSFDAQEGAAGSRGAQPRSRVSRREASGNSPAGF